ncbi:hypothetical protein P1X14_12070 [Sphingomonas sp. AOB5]|uniref:hypothetical protein n=1 Tax=Sphingomonas sp. AOB5 TaxID=3034017 RepID=UPI0023F93B56|nr:hypothetical protein [Sphingomonas sp. AOB5]MDF7775985.1 hypothetical protein [Sphingomonas sp. AOB5]
MDLNYLFHRQQVSLMRADAATCTSSRFSHLGMAQGYADRIRSLQLSLGAGVVAEQAV